MTGNDNRDGDQPETSNPTPPIPPPTQKIPHTNGNGPVSITTDTNGMIKVLPFKTAEEVMARERERKARTTLLMALPEDHLAKFHKMVDAKEMFQTLLSLLEIHGIGVLHEDANQKFLRSLPSFWSQVALIMRTKPGLNTFSFDDLYNNLRVFERDVKGTTASSSSNTKNVAFVSADNTSSTNDVSTVYSVSSPSVSKSQKEGSADGFEMVVAMIFMRTKKFHKRTGKKLQFDTKDPVGFDKTKVECFNYHKIGHFARDYRAKGNQNSRRRDGGYNGNKARDNGRRPAYQDNSKALVTMNRKNIDWSGYVEEDTQNYTMMAYSFSNSGSDNESVFMNKECDLEDTPVNDRYAKGMHAVPPPMIGNYIPSRPDTMHQRLSVNLKCRLIIEEYESDSDDDSVSNVPENIEKPSFAFIDSVKHVKSPRENVKETGTFNHIPKIEKQNRYGHTRKGLGYNKKACFVCDSFSHLIRDCNFHEKRMAKQAALTKSKDKAHDRDKAHLTDYQEFKGGSIAFGGSNGRITGKGKIKAGMLDFEDVYYVEELKHYNLFSVSQMCDKKNKVLFTDTDCLVMSPDFKLPDENQKGKQHKASCKAKEVDTYGLVEATSKIDILQGIFLCPMENFNPHTCKRTGWNEFIYSMASVVICLATGRKFNLSKYIFNNMVKNVDSPSKFLMIGKGFSSIETPLFATMLVQPQANAEEEDDEDEGWLERKDEVNAVAKEVNAVEPTVFDDESMQEKHLDNIKKYQSLKRKPISVAQAKKNVIVYLKNMVGYKIAHFKGMNYDHVRLIFEREYNEVQTFLKTDRDKEPTKKRCSEETLLRVSFKKLRAKVEVLGSHSTQDTPTDDPKEMSEEDVKNMLQIIPVSEFKVEALQVKYPLIDWEIYSEGSRSYWKIIRVGGITQAFRSFKDMVKDFNREDLDALWRLTNEKFNQVSSTKRHDIFMFLEKDYPLTDDVLLLMLSTKLQVDEDCEMARNLVMKIFMEANKPKSRKSLDTSSNKANAAAEVTKGITVVGRYSNKWYQSLGFNNRFVIRFATTRCNGLSIEKGLEALGFCLGSCDEERDDKDFYCSGFLDSKSYRSIEQQGFFLEDPMMSQKKVNTKPVDYAALNQLSHDFETRFVSRTEFSAKQVFWSQNPGNSKEPNLSTSTTIVEVPKKLPKVSMVKSSLKKLKFHLANFDMVVKERTTATAITEGTWGFEHTKAFFRDEIIPFVKASKELFNLFDHFFIDELTEVQNVFNQIEQAIEQHCFKKNKFQDKMKDVLKENEQLLEQAISTDIVNKVVNANMNYACKTVNECERCVTIKTELQRDYIKKECYDKFFKQYTTFEKHCISLEVVTQLEQEIFQRNNLFSQQSAPTFDQLFEINDLKAQSQEKDTIIMKLNERIKSFSGNLKKEKIKRELEEIDTINIELDHRVTKLVAKNEHLKQTYKELYDSIKSSHSSGKFLVITALKDTLTKIKGKDVVNEAVTLHPIDPELLKINVAPLAPKLQNNMTTHYDYLKHTQEETATIREIVKNKRLLNPLNTSLDYACKYTKRIQELLIILKQTFPCINDLGTKLMAVTPVNNNKKIRFTEHIPSSGNTHIKTTSSTNIVSNKHMLSSTGVNLLTSASGSQPQGNIKKDRIQQTQSIAKKNKLEYHPRNRPLGRTFTLVGNVCPLIRITTTAIVPLRKPIPIESNTSKPVVTLVYSRKSKEAKKKVPVSNSKINKSLVVQIVLWYLDSRCSKHMIRDRSQLINFVQKFLDTVKFENDHVAKIMGYGNYKIGNVTISNVYFVEGLGHNLFSVKCLRSKDEAPDLIIKFLKMIQVGISHETSVARSPHQNGVIERPNHTLIEAAYTISRPALNEMTPATISLGLIPKPSSSTPYVPPLRNDWDLLFQPLFDELLTPPPSVDPSAPTVIDPIADVIPPVQAESTGSPSSTTVDQDAPSPSKSQTTPKTQSSVIPQDVKEDIHDIEVAHMGNDPLFSVPIPKATSTQSSSTVSPHTPVQPDHQIPQHNSKLAKDHPLDNIIDQLSRPISTRLKRELTLKSLLLPLQDLKPYGFSCICRSQEYGRLSNGCEDCIFECGYSNGEKSKLDEDKNGKAVDLSHYHDVPEIYMQEFWATATVHHHSIRFKMDNKKHIVNLEYFREMLHICPRILGQTFDEPPFKEEILAFLQFLGHSGEIRRLTDSTVISSSVSLGFYHKRNVDFAYLLWEDFIYQVEHKETKKSNEMYYLRFTKVIIHYFMSKDPSIPRRNKLNWHYVRDDQMFTTIKLVSRHQNMQQFSAMFPIELTNADIRNSKAYKEDYAVTTGATPPKTKASVWKTKSSSDTTVTPPPTAAAGTRLFTSAKGKQLAKASKVKSLTALSEVAMTKAEQLKISTKRSLQQTHSPKQVVLVQMKELDSDEEGEKFIHPMISVHDEEETRDDESFDPIPKTPKNTDDEEFIRVIPICDKHDQSVDARIETIFETTSQMDVQPPTTVVPLPLSAPTLTPSTIATITTKQQAPTPLTTAPSTLLPNFGSYMDQRMNEAVKVAIQIQSDRLRDEAQAKNEEFLKTIDENMQKIIKKQVKEQVKILIEKMEGNKSIHRSNEQRNLYKALVKAYESDKIILDTFGDTVTLKRRRDDDAEKYEEPSAGSERGSKRRRDGNEPKSASAPKHKATRSASKSTQGSKSQKTSASESAIAEEPMQTTHEMEEPSHLKESARDVYSKRRIIAITKLKIVEWHNYKHLYWITMGRDDDKLYKMFTRSIVIQRHVEDLQLGVESYQKKLNLTRPDTYRSNLKRKEAYITYSNPSGFIYQNKDKQYRLMRIDELHKFSDGMLTDVRTTLDDRLKGIQMKYLPHTIWRKSNKERATAMIQAIDKQLKTRRIMRSLKRFISGRLYEGDFRMLQRTI
nr:ribonuclease H-like domain-containing protein [Tanacetum cinerariifolium]